VCHRVQLGVESELGSVLESVLRAYWERTVKQAGSVPSSAIGSVLESMPGSVLRLYSEVYLGAYSEVYLGAS